jgi:hypothetical protein
MVAWERAETCNMHVKAQLEFKLNLCCVRRNGGSLFWYLTQRDGFHKDCRECNLFTYVNVLRIFVQRRCQLLRLYTTAPAMTKCVLFISVVMLTRQTQNTLCKSIPVQIFPLQFSQELALDWTKFFVVGCLRLTTWVVGQNKSVYETEVLL